VLAAPEKIARQILVEQPVAILREDRRHPDRFVHGQPHEPAKQNVVIELLHDPPLGRHITEDRIGLLIVSTPAW